jgi:hypothetical protein
VSVRFGVDGLNLNFTAYTFVTGIVLAAVLLSVAGQPRFVRVGLYVLIIAFVYGILLNGTRGAMMAIVLDVSRDVGCCCHRRS